jgi:hypothetical protein
MGMGSAPVHGYVIQWDEIKKLCPVQTAMLEAVLEHDESDLDSLARDIQQQEDINDEVNAALNQLFDAFKKVTSVGEDSDLELELSCYDSDSGDRYDDVSDGAVWMVHGMTQLSPAGEKFQKIVQESMWTVYG